MLIYRDFEGNLPFTGIIREVYGLPYATSTDKCSTVKSYPSPIFVRGRERNLGIRLFPLSRESDFKKQDKMCRPSSLPRPRYQSESVVHISFWCPKHSHCCSEVLSVFHVEKKWCVTKNLVPNSVKEWDYILS